jgi:hypothetical protein
LVPLFPSDHPALTIALTNNQIRVSWPTAAAGFVLESAATLDKDAGWTPLTSLIQTNSIAFTCQQSLDNQSRFYRLRRTNE